MQIFYSFFLIKHHLLFTILNFHKSIFLSENYELLLLNDLQKIINIISHKPLIHIIFQTTSSNNNFVQTMLSSDINRL